ncbi:MAG: hypothetical protein WKF85_04115 [Chitinophagaceae bacterium]
MERDEKLKMLNEASQGNQDALKKLSEAKDNDKIEFAHSQCSFSLLYYLQNGKGLQNSINDSTIEEAFYSGIKNCKNNTALTEYVNCISHIHKEKTDKYFYSHGFPGYVTNQKSDSDVESNTVPNRKPPFTEKQVDECLEMIHKAGQSILLN